MSHTRTSWPRPLSFIAFLSLSAVDSPIRCRSPPSSVSSPDSSLPSPSTPARLGAESGRAAARERMIKGRRMASTRINSGGRGGRALSMEEGRGERQKRRIRTRSRWKKSLNLQWEVSQSCFAYLLCQHHHFPTSHMIEETEGPIVRGNHTCG